MNFRILSVFLLVCLFTAAKCGGQDLNGLWDAQIQCPGGDIQFGLDLRNEADRWQAFLVNGPERIEVPIVQFVDSKLTLKIDHYDSVVEMTFSGEKPDVHAAGTWKKRRGPKKWLKMECSATRHEDLTVETPAEAFIGRFAVKFSSSEDPAVGVFKKAENSNRVLGTFLTTTGDYRYLDGYVKDDKLQLSCFDGAHAFLFHAQVNQDRTLKGDFWSSSTWHETWIAKRDDDAQLPDDFLQTKIIESVDWGKLSFPDLDGKLTKLDDPKLAGKARIVYVFGSWCPNCHDAGEYFASLEKKYGPRGLSILGLAFEHTGDFERDAEQVRTYLKRHGSTYPVLIAGLSDKKKASESLPILDRIRSYPTTIFLDRKGKVTAVHTGFTGPATEAAYDRLKQKFEKIIDENLNQ